RSWALPSPGSESLYRLSYDLSQSLHSSCPQPANTNGRLLMREDSFGKTWYQYDAEGRPTAEIRLRGPASTCSADVYANPHTFSSIAANGNLSQIVSPPGRTVNSLYATPPAGSTNDRVSDVQVTTWDGTAWSASTLISRAAWEPYGALRGYQINHPTSGDSSAVEYALGDRAGDPLYPNRS